MGRCYNNCNRNCCGYNNYGYYNNYGNHGYYNNCGFGNCGWGCNWLILPLLFLCF